MADEIRSAAERLIERAEADVPTVTWINIVVPKYDAVTVARYALAAAKRIEHLEAELHAHHVREARQWTKEPADMESCWRCAEGEKT